MDERTDNVIRFVPYWLDGLFVVQAESIIADLDVLLTSGSVTPTSALGEQIRALRDTLRRAVAPPDDGDDGGGTRRAA
jgi:hypothetical protein